MMLIGLSEYLKDCYNQMIFDTLAKTGDRRVFHLHSQRVATARVVENLKYDITLDMQDTGVETLPKTRIKCVYRLAHHEEIAGQMRIDHRVRKLRQHPILSPAKRFHVKNKSLFPLMNERKVLFITLLEGEVLRGIIGGFSRYEILLRMRGGLPVTVMRHAIFEIRDKTERSYLKQNQQICRDWKKSPLYVGE